jgi:hypothetical protein
LVGDDVFGLLKLFLTQITHPSRVSQRLTEFIYFLYLSERCHQLFLGEKHFVVDCVPNLSLRMVILQSQVECVSGEVVLTGEIQVDGKSKKLSCRCFPFFEVVQYR